ncbi:TetR/AcrR family transcriptional regulator [Streptomyces dubilierae]|uniref:TetR/AcrR family transcriptional regulator n=1 Tax=Streptomyces dubilierae TaxID=3075533 RepID=A0ABU2P4A7_9ACTN|nr:TetR/AcrR family transcriptional regulator [Streptomyces sp. DSM 41921]MDT0386180.1 TetR/AcrR family transcriptional regulator [Streptomyces sp. DSM 41921]
MSTTHEPDRPQHSHLDSVQEQLKALIRDFRHGAWQPTALEHRLAELLAHSAAGTGSLSAAAIRAALWEGSMAAVHENGGRFITLLADLLPLIEKPDATALHTAGLGLDLVETITQTEPHPRTAPPPRARPCPSRADGDRSEVTPPRSPRPTQDGRRMRVDAARNHARLLNAAALILRERGLQHLTMEAVATAAGVGKGTVFRRFGDRTGLLQALLQRSEDAFQAAHLNGLDQADSRAKAIEQLHAFGVTAIRRYAEEMELQLAAEPSPHQRHRRAPRRTYHERVSILLSLAAPEADAELLSHALLGYLEPALLWHLSDQCNVPLQRLESGWLELVSRLTQEARPHTT